MRRILRATLCCVSLLLCACPDEGAGYAYDHRSEVRYDCEETVACRSSGGAPVGDDPVEGCVDDSSDRLANYSESERSLFEVTFERCSQYRACEYYACTQADGTYSMAHVAEIQHHCNQATSCRAALGEALPSTATAECVTLTSNMLDMATAMTRTMFEMRFGRCAALPACDYVNCQ